MAANSPGKSDLTTRSTAKRDVSLSVHKILHRLQIGHAWKDRQASVRVPFADVVVVLVVVAGPLEERVEEFVLIGVVPDKVRSYARQFIDGEFDDLENTRHDLSCH